MAVAFSELMLGENNVDQSNYTTASVTLTAGRLYIMALYTTKSVAGNPTAIATTGGAVTFTSKNASTSAPASYSVWYCVPSSTVTDTILITVATATGCSWSLAEVTGAKTTGSPAAGADAFVTGQQVQALSSNNAVVTATLSSNIAAGNARYTLGQVAVNETITVSSGTWTSGTNNGHGAPTAAMRVAWNASPAATDTSATWTGTSTTSTRRSYITEIAALAGDFVGSIPI